MKNKSQTIACYQSGLTLIELLIGLAISSMLMATLISLMSNTMAASGSNNEQINLQTQAQFALQRIAAKIRTTPNTQLIAKADNASSGTWLFPTTFDLRAGTKPGTLALTETTGPTTRILAEPVSNFSVTSIANLTDPALASAQSVITVSLTLKSNDAKADVSLSTRMGAAL